MATGRSPASSDEQFTRGRFSGKVAIVTGGASGIGEATVRRFLNDGAAVAIFDINDKRGKELETTMKSSGHNVIFYCVDVSDRDQCVQVVDRVAGELGRVNFLCNNAVYFGSKGVDARKEDWDKTMAVNVQGYSNMVQACLPHMKKNGAGQCAVVNLSSISAHAAQPCRWTYASSKGAIISLTKCMALDLAAAGIRVNSVSPGWIYTPEVAKAAAGERARCEPLWGKFHMMCRLGEPKEVSAAITYLCSNDSSFITSVDLPVDGGYLGMSAEGLGENSKFEEDCTKFRWPRMTYSVDGSSCGLGSRGLARFSQEWSDVKNIYIYI